MAVKLHRLFTNGAILQRDAGVPVWGTATKGAKVKVEFNGQEASTTAKDGKWTVRLKPMKAGGPYTMTVSSEGKSVQVRDVLVGEVWVSSGQSNMQWPLRWSDNAEKTAADSTDPLLRFFTVPMGISKLPRKRFMRAPIPRYRERVDLGSDDSQRIPRWEEAAPETTPHFSAVAYWFARHLRDSLGVPVGIINASWGGTLAEAWTSKRVLRANPDNKPYFANPPEGPNQPSVLYNGMISPLIPYAIRGAIWYQGESNAARAWAYRRSFPEMIADWRDAWGQGDFPFLFVQIAPWQKIEQEPMESSWAELMEAQLVTSQTFPNTAMAVITDYGDEVDIHPKWKEPVGRRLALAARAKVYGEKVLCSGPVYKAMKVDGDKAVLSFDCVGSGLASKGGELKGFTIAGEDRKFENAQAQIEGDKVVVWSPKVKKPAAVRFGWANCPVVNLFNKEDLPASPFRTDNFPVTTQPK